MKLLVVICDRKKTKRIINLLNQNDIHYHVTFYGEGTANNEMLDYLGLIDTEKEIIFAVHKKDKITSIINELENAPSIKNHGAVAFAVPLDAINKSTQSFIEK